MDHHLRLSDEVGTRDGGLEERIKLRGHIHIVCRDKDGHLKHELEMDNLITTAGKSVVAALLNGEANNKFDYIALGTGTTAAAIGDTTLQTETHRGQDASTSRSTNVLTVDKLFTMGGSFTISEAGLLNAASTGTLLARQVFTGLPLVSGDTLTLTWTITAS